MRKIRDALEKKHFETARRLCLQELETGPANRDEILKWLHEAYRNLGDIPACLRILDEIEVSDQDDRLEILLKQAENFQQVSAMEFYRVSQEAAEGYTATEYKDKMVSKSSAYYREAKELADTAERKRRLAESLSRSKRSEEAEAVKAELPAEESGEVKTEGPVKTGSLGGTITLSDGAAAAGCQVTLGLESGVGEPDTNIDTLTKGVPPIGDVNTLETTTDEQGRYHFEDVPEGGHEFLAVTLDPMQYNVPTRFLAHYFSVEEDQHTKLDAVAEEWQSVPPEEVASVFPEKLEREGVSYRLVHELKLNNPCHYDFPRQLVSFQLPPGAPVNPDKMLLLEDPSGEAQPFQFNCDGVHFLTTLPAVSHKVVALYSTDNVAAEPGQKVETLAPVPEEDGESAVIDTGKAAFRIPWQEGDPTLPPLLAVKAHDQKWRGGGRFVMPEGVSLMERRVKLIEQGPVLLTVELAYQLSDGGNYTIRLTAHRDEAYLLVHEISPKVEGAAFEFSLEEFSGGRGFMHWTPEKGNIHWSDLKAEERVLARMEDSIPWWCPPECFAYAMTPDGLEEKDYIGVFTIRRGDWIDREFEKVCHGPGDENRELEWPFPEVVGSTISMITAHTNPEGDAFFHFGFFDGERHWGILASNLPENDGACKELSQVQHKNSSPRLQDFKNWHLDEQDRSQRPSVVADRENLIALRRKRQNGYFADFWNKIVDNSEGPRHQTSEGLRCAVDANPADIWREKKKMVHELIIWTRMCLLGRDHGVSYSPVGGRKITLMAENYDLIAASGVFTPQEERQMRASFMVLGHLFMNPDFMNWQYGARGVNFEADRLDIIGTIGFAFPDNPDAETFTNHTVELIQSLVETYCTPGSGRWYENPACYYLHAAKCITHLAFHLWNQDIFDAGRIPRFRDFLRWGPLLLTPAVPEDYETMRDGIEAQDYEQAPKVRHIPPIGDHAHLGRQIPEHYGLMAKLYRKRDPAFADFLQWAFNQRSEDGVLQGNAELVFAHVTEEDVTSPPPQELTSRRLEGFGAVFRNNFGTEEEGYMLLKLGPGGYRYHRTEGSILFFADGRPLVYDGGEGKEAWRHTTLTFYDTHMPPSAGHIERFATFPGLDFAQGVHPVALKPGQRVYLNENPEHELVDVAYRRFHEPNPAVSRSVTSVNNEYLILNDQLNIDDDVPSYWHLQAVADEESGNWQEGYRFRGRFGVDLQVSLPDQHFSDASIETQPFLENRRKPEDSFAMRHLMLTGDKPDHYLAVLRPLNKQQELVSAESVQKEHKTVGVAVKGEGIDDLILQDREGVEIESDGVSFTGRYGAVISRPEMREYVIMDGQNLRAFDAHLTSDGPATCMRIYGDEVELIADGEGRVTFAGPIEPVQLEVSGGRTRLVMHREGGKS